ncbi:MAG: ArsR/SmtB family transcription factor [Solirubrobacteraceae bacterium]
MLNTLASRVILQPMPADRSSRKKPPQARRGQPKTGGEKTSARHGRAGDEDTLQLHDPREIRALAHPARMAIIDALASGDELTATECAELTGLSPSATAYHLNFLERYDFAEPAPARNDGRERPWRATDRRTLVDLDTSTPAGAAAATAVGLAFIDRSRALAQAFVATAHEEPKEWQDVALLANADLWLTAQETRKVTAELAAVLEPYRSRALANRPDGTRRVRVMNLVFPHRQN